MKTIWKYPLALGENLLDMPRGAELLAVQMQGGAPMLWALVDVGSAGREQRRLRVVGTGHTLPQAVGRYVCTFQEPPFVWHVFDGGALSARADK